MTAVAVQYEADWGTPQDPIGGLIRAGATWEGDWGPAPPLDPVGRILEGAHRPWQPVDSKYDVWQAVGRFAWSPDPCSYPEWDPLAAALRVEAPQGERSTGFGFVQAAGWLDLAWHDARSSRQVRLLAGRFVKLSKPQSWAGRETCWWWPFSMQSGSHLAPHTGCRIVRFVPGCRGGLGRPTALSAPWPEGPACGRAGSGPSRPPGR